MTHCELGTENRRRANRINREVAVNWVDHGQRVSQSVALNVSASGARLVLTENCPNEFTLQLDPHTIVLARPVWKRHLSRFSVVGVEFAFTSPSQRRNLERFLRRLAA